MSAWISPRAALIPYLEYRQPVWTAARLVLPTQLGVLPGGPAGQLVQLVLAEDVFAQYAAGDGAHATGRALAAAQAAARRWAPDCVARGRLLAYLQHTVPAVAAFLVCGAASRVWEY